MIHKMRLVNFAFEEMKVGRKDVEVRLNDEKRQLIKVGDIIEFTNLDTGEILNVKVIKLFLFNTFNELFNYFPHSRLGLKESVDESIMNKFYTEEELKKYKALGIQIEIIK